LKVLFLISISFLFVFENAWACVEHDEIVNSGDSFETSILFHKPGEYYAVQQHLIYYKGRPYFNYSLCMKNASAFGYSLEEASHYDLENDCNMLGPWLPVYGPRGEEVFRDYFYGYFSKYLDEYMGDLAKRDKLAPMVDSFKAMLGDFDDLMLTAAGVYLVRHAYMNAPMANNFRMGKNGKGGGRGVMRAGWLFMLIGALGFVSESYQRQESANIHKDKLQGTINAMDRTLREMNILAEPSTPRRELRTYGIHASIVDRIVRAYATAFISMDEEQKWICEPLVPESVLEFENQFRIEI